MKVIAIIPARFGSSRLEGKPLLDILGKPMIQRVYEQSKIAFEEVYVATDDERIRKTVEDFGGKVVMTAVEHQNGTTRCLEAYERILEITGQQFDVIVNVQGDEPMLEPEQLKELVMPFEKEGVRLSTLVTPVLSEADFFNEGEVFTIFDKNKRAIYFSRAVIPYIRGVHKTRWLNHHKYYKHVGLYAYTYEALKEFAGLPASDLELLESLEQNRWIEHGNQIHVEITHHESFAVDTIDDLKKIRSLMKQRQEDAKN